MHLDWTHLTEESKVDYVSSTPSLMILPTALIDYCLRFLHDEDLKRAYGTCKFILAWFRKHYRGGYQITANDCLFYLGPCRIGLIFESLTHLNIQLLFESFDFKHLSSLLAVTSIFRFSLFYIIFHIFINYPKEFFLPTNFNFY